MSPRSIAGGLILALFLALLADAADAAELVARSGSDSVRLTEAPCTAEPVLERLPPPQRAEYRAAVVDLGGTTYTACWRVLGSHAHLIYEDGDQGLIPLRDFKAAIES